MKEINLGNNGSIMCSEEGGKYTLLEKEHESILSDSTTFFPASPPPKKEAAPQRTHFIFHARMKVSES